jgi:glutamyl-tRNA reductase
MHLVQIGLSHKTAPIDLRERLSISKAQLPGALENLLSVEDICECVIVSTCNRTEVYAYAGSRVADQSIIDWFGQFCGVPTEQFKPYIYTKAGHKAAEQLFRVTSGMDSMALGETQIQGQAKEAYATAVQTKTTGSVLNTLFQQGAAAGKRVLSETGIGRGAFSVGSAAARLVKQVFSDLSSSTLLIVGAGQMADLTTSHLASYGLNKLLVTNRTYERAVELAQRFDGQVIRFEDLASAIEKADIIVSSTGSESQVITKSMVSAAMHARRGRPIFIIDVAVPRDVEESVGNLDNVILYNVDDLQAVVEANDAKRRAEFQKAELIIAEEVEEFNQWFRTLDAVPVITALREKFDRIRAVEMEKLSKKLKHLKPEEIEAINAAMGSVVNKICHEPMIQIKECATKPDSSVKLEAMCEVFGLCLTDTSKDKPGASEKHAKSAK